MLKKIGSLLVVVAVCGFGLTVQANVMIDTVPVGNPGNAGEWSGESYGGFGPDRICGAVGYTYNISTYEVTAGQYTAFLNAVAALDTHGLYNTSMWSNDYGCKIERSGPSGSYRYSVAADRANRPVNYVSYWDALRFANWLHNGQPIGVQEPGTTETGAYTLDGYNGYDGREIQRNPDWTWAVTSEDEWHKAAYHKNDGVTGNYWAYPTGSNDVPSNQLDPAPNKNANFVHYEYGHTIGSPYWRTEVGAFRNSDSPYGTFDQGGNVYEWTEGVVAAETGWAARGLRGGEFDSDFNFLHASYRVYGIPTFEHDGFGFRVSAAVPEPASIVMLALAGVGIIRRR